MESAIISILTLLTIFVVGSFTIAIGRVWLVAHRIVELHEIFGEDRWRWPRFLLLVAVIMMIPNNAGSPAMMGLIFGCKVLLADLLFVAMLRYATQYNSW